jgi:hypothetical protein
MQASSLDFAMLRLRFEINGPNDDRQVVEGLEDLDGACFVSASNPPPWCYTPPWTIAERPCLVSQTG